MDECTPHDSSSIIQIIAETVEEASGLFRFGVKHAKVMRLCEEESRPKPSVLVLAATCPKSNLS